ncbi:MAG TPA: hypothetical protein VEY33_04150 [Gemmatimonadota bacterium]|nr:hypothetical protein [Gemmatimonadota bacterium]
MSQQELLTYVGAALDRAGIDYMITGSIVSSLQGEPRLTHDLDVLLAIQSTQVDDLLDAFPGPRFYVDAQAVEGAIRTSGMFNVIDTIEGDKIDFWLLRDEPFDRSRFGRKYQERLFGTDVKVSSPEDTILAKLWWARLSGGSEKYFQDALRVYEVQGTVLDDAYP